MNVLGLSSLDHDTAAALLNAAGIKAAIENDKLVRSKYKGLPEAAIAFCLEQAGCSWRDLDCVAVATCPLPAGLRRLSRNARLAGVAPVAALYHQLDAMGTLAHSLTEIHHLRQLAGRGKVEAYDHHLCHAASAFYCSQFERALIITMDEDGDGVSGIIALGEGARIRILRRIPFPNSLAWIYSQITQLIGFVPHKEEHKTHWFSVQGEPSHTKLFVEMLLDSRGVEPRLNRSYLRRGLDRRRPAFSAEFYRRTGLPEDSSQWREEQRRSLARSLQEACAEILFRTTTAWRRQQGITPICLAGGLFLNSSLVAALEHRLGRSEVFVPPAPGNAGTALGAAYLAWHCRLGQARLHPGSSVYWGPRFNHQQHKDVLDNCKARYSLQNTEERKIEATAQLLYAGKIVGWVQGATEFGPRALGNRSILASPWAPYVKENLNDFIKHREWFRPFAVSIAEEDCDRYFEASSQCRFMNSLATIRPGSSCLPESFLLPGGQVRLHVVAKDSNPLFWALLKRFSQQAPAPMLLNTSFNLHGEPLVVTPQDAIRTYFCSGLDALVMDNFVLAKSGAGTVLFPGQAATRMGLSA